MIETNLNNLICLSNDSDLIVYVVISFLIIGNLGLNESRSTQSKVKAEYRTVRFEWPTTW